MNIRQVPCIFGPCLKDLSNYITYYIEITCHYMATWGVQKLWIREVARWGILGKTSKVEVLQSFFVIEYFGNNRTGIAKINTWRLLLLKVRRDFIFDGLLVEIIANIQSDNVFIGEFDIRNGWFLVSVSSPTLTSLNRLFEEISKITPWSRCPDDPTSVKCKFKVDSYKACSRFNGIEYSLVRIWRRPNCKLTNGKSPSNETSCISVLSYFIEPWLRCLLLVLSNRFKTFSDWHPHTVQPNRTLW